MTRARRHSSARRLTERMERRFRARAEPLLHKVSDVTSELLKPVSNMELDPAVLQDQLLRFEGRFIGRMVDATAHWIHSADPRLRKAALDRRLVYASSSIEIVLGMDPIANLVDFVTFMELCTSAAREHWQRMVFTEQGDVLVQALDESRRDIWDLCSNFLQPSQIETLSGLIADWRSKNPNLVTVEFVRLSSIPFGTDRVSGQARKKTQGLFRDLRGAVKTADSALLFGERVLYYTQKLPFLARLHAAVAYAELLEESERRFLSASRRIAPRIRQLAQGTREIGGRAALLGLAGAIVFGWLQTRRSRPG